MNKAFFVFLFLITNCSLFAQIKSLSEDAQISLITCASGDELYYSFGHSAIRVEDRQQGIDIIYNYGTFDFDRPNFYLNFMKGKLIYSLTRRGFAQSLYQYEYEKRWVKQQIFDLTLEEKNQLLRFLEENHRPENRDYLYDPIFNNCSTITGDILKNEFGDSLIFNDSHLKENKSIRDLIQEHLHWNSWYSLGLDLCTGSVIDRSATPRERLFAPYYAMYQIRNTTLNGKPLLKRERTVLDYPEHEKKSNFLFSPFFWFSALFLFVFAITYLDYKHDKRNRWIDLILFTITGIIGLLALILWLATDHNITQVNLNILWAFPLNLWLARSLFRNEYVLEWVGQVLHGLVILLGATTIVWMLQVQAFSYTLIPFLLTLLLRYSFLLYRYYIEEYE